MKKVVALLLSLSLMLMLFAGCTKIPEKPPFEEATTVATEKPETTEPTKEEDVTVRIAADKGPASIGMVYLLDSIDKKQAIGDYTYEIFDDTNSIGEKLIAGEVDIAAVPIEVALNLYKQNKGAIKLIAITSYSNLYLVELNEVSISVNDFSDYKGNLYVGNGTMAASIMKFIFGSNDLSVNINTQYSNDALQNLVKNGRILHGVLPEPFATTSTEASGNEKIGLDVSDLWAQAVSGTDYADSKICSTCLIANANFLSAHKKATSTFLTEVKSSVKNVNSQTTAAKLTAGFGFAETEELAYKIIPDCSLCCKTDDDAKTLLSGFLGALSNYSESLVPVVLEDDFYYIAE